MADDLSLLFRIRGDAAGAKQAAAETRAAVASLRSQLGGEFNAIQSAGQGVLSNLGNGVNVFVGQRIPLIGGAFLRVTENLKGFGAEAAKGDAAFAGLTKTIDGLSSSTGKTRSEITSFLTSFVQLETQAKRDSAAIETFGAATAQTLIPQLEKAGEELTTVASTTEAAGASMAAMAGPIGIAVVATAALAVGAALLSKEFFDLIVSTAEWEGKMQDLSQQVGISTETLSALEILAKTTGGSIEGLTASLGIFQKKLEEAQDPESKTAKLLKDLGIETNNTEEAFRQAITVLGGMEEGYHQTATALELFGRGGKSILAIIKETNGDLDGAIEKFREMGLIISTEDAKAADAFNDQMAILGFQFRAASAVIVKEAIPALTSIAKSLSENQEAVHALATVLGDLSYLITKPLEGAFAVLEGTLKQVETLWLAAYRAALLYYGVSLEAALQSVPSSTNDKFGGVRGGIQGVSNRQSTGFAGVQAGLGLETGASRAAAAEKVSAGQRLLNQLTDEYNRLVAKDVELGKMWLTIEELKKKEYDDIDPKLRNRIIGEAGLIDIENERVKEKKKAADQDKIQADAEQKYVEKLKLQAEDRAELELRIADAVENQRQALSELEGFEKSHLQTVEEYILAEVKRAEALGGVTDKMREYFALLIQIAAKEDEIEAKKKADAETKRQFESQGEGHLPNAPRDLSGLSQFQKLQVLINDHFKEGTLKANLFSGALEGMQVVAQGVGQALGNVLQSFILFGNAGTTFKKFAAEVAASVAQMAVVKAVYEVAEGLAAVARAIFGDPKAGAEAVMHFKAAAAYGIVAGVAAVAGRAIAGNSFAEGGSSGGGSGGSSGGGSRGGSGSNNGSSSPIVMGSQRGPDVIHLVVEHRASPAFQSVVVDAYVRDHENGGRSRQVQIKEMKRQE